MMKMFPKFMIMISLCFSVTSTSITITSGPQDTTVCMNVMAPCVCGFTGGSPDAVTPDWRIIYRNDSGSVISNRTIDGGDISSEFISGFQWVADFDSGGLNAPNSKLLVGPVNMTHNQSSYQCMFPINVRGGGSDTVMSSVGTMTVVDSPSVTINIDKVCTTSIIISLNIQNHPACGDVSYNVTISGNAVYPDGDSKYLIDGLQSDTLHNIAVTSTYNNNGSRIFNRFERTSSPELPNPINSTGIIFENTSRNSVRIIWEQPKFDGCLILAVKHYDLKIYSGEVEIKAENIPPEQNYYLATFLHEHFSNHLSTTFTVNITVVDMLGQRSTTLSVNVTINTTQSQITSPSPTEENSMEPDAEATDNNDSKPILITVPIVAAVLIILSIFIIISILYLRYRRNKVKNLRIATEENCYTTQDECKSQDLASPYAVSGSTSLGSNSNSMQSNSAEVTLAYEPSVHTDHTNGSVHNENIDKDESTPPLPPKLNYAELQLDNAAPKFMSTDNHVTYIETKPK